MLTFFLQVHDLTRSEDHQIINWQVDMYEVEELVKVARERGLEIPYETQVKLYAEKDDGI